MRDADTPERTRSQRFGRCSLLRRAGRDVRADALPVRLPRGRTLRTVQTVAPGLESTTRQGEVMMSERVRTVRVE